MERPYDQGVSADVVFYVGEEIEHTPAYGMRTLFVVGIQDPDEILRLAKLNQVEHVYFGASASFVIDQSRVAEHFDEWTAMIKPLMELDFWITVDYHVTYHESVLEEGWNEYDQFISLISVPLPYIDQLNYNACLKIDDKDFRASNAGVWIQDVHGLKDRSRFTKWSEYKNDKIIKEDDNAN
jgi:hypothetical protein